MPPRRGAGRTSSGFHSLIVVTSNYHMPRAIVELSHAMPDIQLIPFSVIGEKWRDEPWWTSRRDAAAAAVGICQIRRRGSCGCGWRMLGIDLHPNLADAAGRAPAAQPATAASQLIGYSMTVDLPALAGLQRAVLSAAGVLDHGRAFPTFLMPLARVHGGRQDLGAQQRLADAGGLQHQRRISRAGENPDGPLIVASKHQSMWETFALLPFFDAPLFIYKRELAWIPFFGWYLMKSGMIGIDRGGGVRALMDMARRAREGNSAAAGS